MDVRQVLVLDLVLRPHTEKTRVLWFLISSEVSMQLGIYNSRGQDGEELDGPLINLPLDPPGPL